MTPELSAHLSEEALYDVLIGIGTPEADAHLDTCASCRGQLEEFRSEMEMFNEASLAWSEARPPASLRVAFRRKTRQTIVAAAGWALAAACFLVIGLPVWNHYRNLSVNHAVAVVAPQEDSAAQIAQDNELLQAVDAALNAPEASPFTEYQLPEGPHPHAKARPEVRNQ